MIDVVRTMSTEQAKAAQQQQDLSDIAKVGEWLFNCVNSFHGALIAVSGNKVCVCYHLCIRHMTESMFVLHIISEIMRCCFLIKEKCFTQEFISVQWIAWLFNVHILPLGFNFFFCIYMHILQGIQSILYNPCNWNLAVGM